MKLKKKVKRFLIIFLIIIVAAVGGFVFYEMTNTSKVTIKKATVLNEIKEYGYTLKSNKSKAYKKEFANLTTILNSDTVDEEAYLKSITKLFILDFYTLSDKVANTDVGGVDFIHTDAKTNFLEKAEDTIYKYVENNMYGGRRQDLPTVQDVTIEDIQNVSFTLNQETDTNAYQVTVSWTYTKENDYQNKASLTFAHEGEKLSLVEMK
ncbi:MAG: hypothetical protein PUB03_04020 [bacterium]|nr:hypothetical protein [bacterium]